MDILLVQIGWVVQTMADGSVRVTRTSLNQDVLNFYGVKPKENFSTASAKRMLRRRQSRES